MQIDAFLLEFRGCLIDIPVRPLISSIWKTRQDQNRQLRGNKDSNEESMSTAFI
jgi:hypothetical protein